MHIQLDTLGGIAGDMFIASVLDAWPEFSEDTLAVIRMAGVPLSWDVSVIEHRDNVFRGRRFAICESSDVENSHHQNFRDIVLLLRQSSLDPVVCDRAVAIFRLLAQAEAEVHGVSVEDVAFHEVGAWDSIGDIVGAAFLIEALGPDSWSVGSIPLGGGRVETAHGPMPVPAPATARLLRGFKLFDDGIDGERVTPTGAAILSYLRQELGPPLTTSSGPMTLGRSGTGFGTRVLPGISNILRVITFDDVSETRISDHIGVIHFEIDDQTAEDLAAAIDALRADDGILDVLQIPAVGKKGRMVFHVQVLCRRDALNDVIEKCFVQTTTIGLRWTVTERAKLNRETILIDESEQSVAVKLAKRPNGRTTAKVELEDIRESDCQQERQMRRRTAEQRALGHSD